jgi:hypothetical protein
VFQVVPHASKNGSGVSYQKQHQALEAAGCQPQSGHRMRPNSSASSDVGLMIVIGGDTGPFFSSSRPRAWPSFSIAVSRITNGLL